MNKTFFQIKKQDFLSSFVVFIVAVPLSLGIGIASGMSPEAAMIAAAVGGIVVGLFAGAPLMVAGPAAGLIVLTYSVVQEYGLIGISAAIVFCGLFQFLLGILRMGVLFTLIPSCILHGMLAAIGIIITLGQIHVLVGEHIPGSPLKALEMIFPSLQQGLSHEIHIITPVFACGLLAILIQVVWPKIFPRLKWIPGALPAVIIVTLVSLFWEMDRLTVRSLWPEMEFGITRFFQFSWLDQVGTYLAVGLGFALVASAESLLTARATDMLEHERKPKGSDFVRCDLNQELKAQGLGNMTSGVLGGMPLTGVIVRSKANIEAGAQTRWSTVFHGVWVVFFIVAAPDLLNKTPYTALAAVLVVTGFKLLGVRELVQTFKRRKADGAIWVFTMVAIICTNLLTGLGLAVGFALIVNYSAINFPQLIKLAFTNPRALKAALVGLTST